MANGQNFITGFYHRHRIISAIILIILVDCVLLAVSYISLGWFTNHDSHQTVPDIYGLTVEEAESALAKRNLRIEINDSTYIEGVKPGSIIEQNPKAGSDVKDNRTVYVTIRTYATKLVLIPSLTDVSARQGEAMLKSLGIKDVRIQTIPSEFADLVYDARWNGSSLHAGDKVPVNATVTLVVGDGSLGTFMEEELYDSIGGAESDDYVEEFAD